MVELANDFDVIAVDAGKSSGGVLAIWLGARPPELMRAVVAEDSPIFSAEMPRFRDRGRFVSRGLAHLADVLGEVENPQWMQRSLDAVRGPAGMGNLRPRRLSEMFCSLDMFDPDFPKAFVDGRFYGEVDHVELLAALTCPVILLRGDWRRYRNWEPVGAMDADDADRFRMLARETRYVRMPGNHVLHHDDLKGYVREVRTAMTAATTRPTSE